MRRKGVESLQTFDLQTTEVVGAWFKIKLTDSLPLR